MPAVPATSGQFRIGEINVVLRSELPGPLNDFSALYPSSNGEACEISPIQIDVRSITCRPLRRDRYVVYGDGLALGSPHRREEIVPYVEWGINGRIIERRSDFLQIHAATMTRGGRGFVFAGGSGVGKSTLAAGLIQGGWKYLSDEFALIHPASLCVHPFPKVLCIKSGAFDVMRRLGVPFATRGRYVKALKGRVAYVRPRDIRSDALADPTPIDFVIFPKFVGDGRPRLRPIPRAQAAVLLAGHALNRHRFPEHATGLLCDIAERAKCFALESTGLETTAALLDTLN